jgi:hypothetical protein
MPIQGLTDFPTKDNKPNNARYKIFPNKTEPSQQAKNESFM